MKPNTHSGARKHDPTGAPTGLNRKARRAVHSARTSIGPHASDGAIANLADSFLDQWTDGKLDAEYVSKLVNEAMVSIEEANN